MSESDFALVAPTEQTIAKRTKPMLVQDGKRLVPSDRQFHPELAAQYIRDHGGRTRWVDIGELARTFYMRDSKSNCIRIRKRMYRIWNALLEDGLLLVYEIQRAGIRAVKIFDAQSPDERQYVHARLQRMEKQRFLKNEQVNKALLLVEGLEAGVQHEVVPAR